MLEQLDGFIEKAEEALRKMGLMKYLNGIPGFMTRFMNWSLISTGFTFDRQHEKICVEISKDTLQYPTGGRGPSRTSKNYAGIEIA